MLYSHSLYINNEIERKTGNFETYLSCVQFSDGFHLSNKKVWEFRIGKDLKRNWKVFLTKTGFFWNMYLGVPSLLSDFAKKE